jgi:hypothetical protein
MLSRIGLFFLTTLLASAAVDRIELSERSDVLEGKSFGAVGPYERMIGKVYFLVDPKNPANRNIADIDLAPVNEKGLVGFSADLYILKPRDPANGNHSVLLEIPNRGGKGMLGLYARLAGLAIRRPAPRGPHAPQRSHRDRPRQDHHRPRTRRIRPGS